MKRAALAATKTFEGPKLGMPSARVAQRSHERAALAATKTFQGPQLTGADALSIRPTDLLV